MDQNLRMEPVMMVEKVTTAVNTFTPEVKSTKQQTDVIPQRTRRNQTVKPSTKSIAVQCNLPGVCTSCQVSTTTVALDRSQEVPIEQDSENCELEMEDDDDELSDFDPNDPEYIFEESDEEDDNDSGDEDEPETSNYRLEETNNPIEENYYMVSESSLFQLLSVCRTCNNVSIPVIEYSKGTMICTSSVCGYGHIFKWQSQKSHERLPWGNLLLASAIMISGNNTTKVLKLFNQMKLKCLSERTVRRLQSAYTMYAVIYEFDSQQSDLMTSLRGRYQ